MHTKVRWQAVSKRFKAHEALPVRPRRPYNRPGPSEHRLLNKVLLV